MFDFIIYYYESDLTADSRLKGFITAAFAVKKYRNGISANAILQRQESNLFDVGKPQKHRS